MTEASIKETLVGPHEPNRPTAKSVLAFFQPARRAPTAPREARQADRAQVSCSAFRRLKMDDCSWVNRT